MKTSICASAGLIFNNATSESCSHRTKRDTLMGHLARMCVFEACSQLPLWRMHLKVLLLALCFSSWTLHPTASKTH